MTVTNAPDPIHNPELPPKPKIAELVSKQRPFILRYWVTLSVAAITILFAWKGQLDPNYVGLEPWTLYAEGLQNGELWRLVSCHLIAPGILSFVIGLLIHSMLLSSIEGALGSKAAFFFLIFITVLSSSTEIYYADSGMRFALDGFFIGAYAGLVGYQFATAPSVKAFVFSGAMLNFLFILGLIAALEVNFSGGLTPAKWSPLLPTMILGYLWTKVNAQSAASRWFVRLILFISFLAPIGWAIVLIKPQIQVAKLSSVFLKEAVARALYESDFSEADKEKYLAYEKTLGEKAHKERAAALCIAGQYTEAALSADLAIRANEEDLEAHNLMGRISLGRGNRSFARENFNVVLSFESNLQTGIAHFWLAKISIGAEKTMHMKRLDSLSQSYSSLRTLLSKLKSDK